MSKEKRDLNRLYNKVVDDIFDHFDEYKDNEKISIQTELNNLNKLNSLVEGYDKKTTFSDILEKIKGCWQNVFGKK